MFDLERIIEEGLCTGCGLCAGISDQIMMRISDSGYERPEAIGDIAQKDLSTLNHACPALHLRGLDDDTISDAEQFDSVWGPYNSLIKAHAANPETRHRGSTGGVLTALAQYMLASGKVKFILQVKAGGRDPSFGKMQVSTDQLQVLESAGSRYGPSAPLERIGQVLEKNQPFAFVGKPCDISALRSLADCDERVGQLVKAYLTPVCGGYGPPKSTYAFYERIGTSREEVVNLRYRGYGCPGETLATTEKGKVFSATYEQFWGTDSSMWQLPWRCKICPDGIGDAADIAAADDWPNASPDMEAAKSDLGTNAVIVRTKLGAELVKCAVEAGYLVISEHGLSPAYMTSIQPHQMRKKYTVLARWAALEKMGRIKPQSTNLRLEELNQSLTEQQQQDQFEGVRARIVAGKAKD